MAKQDDNYSLRKSLRYFIRLVREIDENYYYKKRLEDNAFNLLHIANLAPLETSAFKAKHVIDGLSICFDLEFLLGEALNYKDLNNYKELSYYLDEIKNIFYGWYNNVQEKKK